MKKIIEKILNNRKRAALLALALLVFLFIGWRLFLKKEEAPQLQTARVEKGTIISSVSASGQIISSNMINITTQASGIVKTVYVENGDLVKKGDKILEVTLDQQGQQRNAQAYSSYLSAKNTLQSAKATQYSLQADMFGDWDNFKELAESESYDTPEERGLPEFHIPEKDWLASELKYKNQEAVIAQTQVAASSTWLSYQLSAPVVTAAASGTIAGLSVAEGMSIENTSSGNTTSSYQIAVIKTEGTPIATFNLSEIDVSQVEPGQKATLILDSFPEKTYTGKVMSVNKVGTVTTGVVQYPAIIQFDTAAAEILPHMAATANIIIDKKENVLLVPSGAIQSQDNQNFVRVFKNNQVQLVPVEIGLVSDTQTEIISGLKEADLVVTNIVLLEAEQAGFSPFGRTSGMGGMMRMAH